MNPEEQIEAIVRYLFTGDPSDAPAATRDFATEVYRNYRQQFRRYHGLWHPTLMRGQLDSLDERMLHDVDQQALAWMVYGHDLIYKLAQKSGWNERTSAAVTERYARQSDLGDETSQMIIAGILATKHHLVDEQEAGHWAPTIKLLIDLDLQYLGNSWEGFCEDSTLVWLEYEPVTTYEQFFKGRLHWAHRFLESRRQIYLTIWGAGFEENAQNNLARVASGEEWLVEKMLCT